MALILRAFLTQAFSVDGYQAFDRV